MDERTILVVEDDADINALLAKIAAREGFGCVQAYSGTEALLQMERAAFDLVLLDMMLPGMDGPTLMACMRDELASRVPVIVVSAKAGSADKVGMLAAGADDYVTKPYNPAVLLARIQSVLRRAARTEPPARIEHKGVVLDVAKSRVEYEGRGVELTRNEFRVLHLLMENKGAIISRQELMMELWQSDAFIDDNTLTVNVNRLRKSLASIGVPEGFLATRRGPGYLV